MDIGYARVSTIDQTLSLQHDALTAVGCTPIYTDTMSGTKDRRPGLDQVLSHLRAGDNLIVWRLDRLGRSLKHLTCHLTNSNRPAFRKKPVKDAPPSILS